MRLSRLAVGLGLLILSLSRTAPANALDLGEWLPGLKLTPFFSERVTYESNVFQVASHSQGDAIFKTIPGFLADYTFGPHSISLGYRAEILNYVTLTAQDTVNHIGVVQLRLEFPKTLFTLRNDFVRTSEPPNTELTGPIESDTNVLASELEYRLTSRFSVGANYSWTHVSFDNPEVAVDLDRNEQLGGVSLFWRLFPKTTLRANYNYGIEIFRFQEDRNVTRQQFLVSVLGDLTPKLSSTLRLGFEHRHPDSSFQPGYTGPIWGGDLAYRPTERTTLTLVTDRSVQESTFGTVPFYVTTSGALGLQQQLWRKVTASLRVAGGVNNYPSKQVFDGLNTWRQDTFYAYGGGLEYEFKPWLSAGVEYAHLGRHSNFPTFSFKDDKFTARVLFQF